MRNRHTNNKKNDTLKKIVVDRTRSFDFETATASTNAGSRLTATYRVQYSIENNAAKTTALGSVNASISLNETSSTICAIEQNIMSDEAESPRYPTYPLEAANSMAIMP